MKRRLLNSKAALACLMGMLWCVAGFAAPGQNVAPSPATVGPVAGASLSPSASLTHVDTAADTATRAPAQPAAHSSLDSELIRHGGDGGSTGSLTTPRPQSLELPRVAGALAIVISLIFLLRWGGKKLFVSGIQGKSTRAVQVLARSSISPRQHILLLRVGRRVIVVGDSGAQMNSLSEISDPDEVASLLGQLQDEKTRLPVKAFSALFSRARDEMGGEETTAAADEGMEQEESGDSVPEVSLDPAISDTREEISGLMNRIRVLSKHFPTGQA